MAVLCVDEVIVFDDKSKAPMDGATGFSRAGERAGLEKRVHPHVFRHMFAVDLSQRSCPLPVISQALGHTNVVVTAQYLRHLDPRAVIEATQGL